MERRTFIRTSLLATAAVGALCKNALANDSGPTEGETGSHAAQITTALTPVGLKAEYLEIPQGLDVLRPRLSWIFAATGRAQMQAALQIQVADSIEQLRSNRHFIWDSGKVTSDQNFGIVYGGGFGERFPILLESQGLGPK